MQKLVLFLLLVGLLTLYSMFKSRQEIIMSPLRLLLFSFALFFSPEYEARSPEYEARLTCLAAEMSKGSDHVQTDLAVVFVWY